VSIGVAAFAWPSPHSQAAPEPISTSLVSIEKKELPARPAPSKADGPAKTDAGLPQRSSQAQTTLQPSAPVAPTAAPIASDLAQSIQMIARELANVEQGIDQLKTGQAQMVHDNAELAEHLKATQELARHNADLTEDLKAAQAQMARDNVNFAEQLRASQEQMANLAKQLKESQEQIARLAASERTQRPKTLASSPLPIANSTRKRVPTPPSPQVRVQTQQ
jgi:septal ring factor EnvC (AmiA/AmiB activator)